MSRSLTVALLASIAITAAIVGAMERGRLNRATRALRVLPSTARAVLQIDPAALAETRAATPLLEALAADSELTEIEATCGLDPWADLGEATVWVQGPDEEPFQSFGLMLTGRRVDAAALAECHARLVEARGSAVIRLEAATGPLLASRDRGSAIALLDDHTVVTGSTHTVAEALAVRRGLLPPLVERAPIASLWPELSPGAAVAAAFDPPAHWKSALERISTFESDPSALEGIVAIGFAVPGGRGRDAVVRLDVASEEHAKRSAALIRSWATSPPEEIEPRWQALLRTARVEVDGDQIRIEIDLTSLSQAR